MCSDCSPDTRKRMSSISDPQDAYRCTVKKIIWSETSTCLSFSPLSSRFAWRAGWGSMKSSWSQVEIVFFSPFASMTSFCYFTSSCIIYSVLFSQTREPAWRQDACQCRQMTSWLKVLLVPTAKSWTYNGRNKQIRVVGLCLGNAKINYTQLCWTD